MRYLKIAVLLLVAACATTGAPGAGEYAGIRSRYVSDHPGMSAEVTQAILDGRVLVGMTAEQASVAWIEWGLPDRVNRTTTAEGESAQYVFRREGQPTRYFYVERGRVVSVQN